MHVHLLLINIPWTCMVYSPKQSTVPQHSPCSLALATCHSPADQGIQPVPFITSFSLESTKNILTLLAGHWAGIGQFSSVDLKYWEKLKIWPRGRQEDFEFDFSSCSSSRTCSHFGEAVPGMPGSHRVTGQLDSLGGIIPRSVLCHQQPH